MTFRRRLTLSVGAALLFAPRLLLAQQTGRTYRVGWFSLTKESFGEPYSHAFVSRLAELGFVEGRNLILERRHADSRLEALPAISIELGKLKCDAYVGGGSEASLSALTRASKDTPILFVAVDFDPVVTGDVASLGRPGGRVTGVSAIQSVLPAKRLELLIEALPGARRIAVLANEQTTGQLSLVQGTARRLGLELQVLDLKRPPFDLPAAFAEAARAKSEAMLVLGSALFVPFRKLIPELALQTRLPTMFHHSQWAEAGGLMSYGFNFPKMYRRIAELLARVLQGARPADLPMEQPTEFEFVVNQKTANALGVKIPPAVRVRANRTIE